MSQIDKRQEKQIELLEDTTGHDNGVSKTAERTPVPKKATNVLRKASSNSSKSSSTSVAYLQAEAERAALKVKAKALEQKHALDMEETCLKAKKEKLALNAELAAADAKASASITKKKNKKIKAVFQNEILLIHRTLSPIHPLIIFFLLLLRQNLWSRYYQNCPQSKEVPIILQNKILKLNQSILNQEVIKMVALLTWKEMLL